MKKDVEENNVKTGKVVNVIAQLLIQKATSCSEKQFTLRVSETMSYNNVNNSIFDDCLVINVKWSLQLKHYVVSTVFIHIFAG